MGNVYFLQRMLANLLDNAMKYTPAGGNVKVQLSHEGDHVYVDVEDTGAPIPDVERSKIFERFYRGDQSRAEQGCGLGLSFSRAVARAHGGDITVISGDKNSNLFRISLPIA
jgi:two-component system sensor histidine kinase TctE